MMRRMLIAQLEGLLAVARERNVTRAAAALGLSQPALSARLKALERELGTALVARSAHGVRLTDAGRALLPHAARAVEAVEDGRVRVDQVLRGGEGTLTLGAAPAVGTYVLPSMLRRFHAEHPRVSLTVRTGHSEEILDLVLRTDVDLGLIRALAHPEIESRPLFDDELVLVVHPDHPFVAAGTVRLDAVAREPVILFDRASSYHEETYALFRQAGVVLRDVMDLDNIDAAKKMVEQRLGVSLLPRTAVAAELSSGALRTIALTKARPIRHRMVVIRRRDAGRPTGSVAAFLSLLA